MLLLVAGAPVAAAPAPDDPVPLFDNLGTLHHPITTRSDRAQRYFDQGLRLVFGFNHEEAVNSFRQAAVLDPDAAMPYWGIAYALGPNINAAMSRESEKRAVEALRQAQARLATAPPSEKAYVEALARRYSTDKQANRKALDKAYAQAMREVARRFPDDTDAATLYAEALMNLSPWDYWTTDSRPKPGLEEVVPTLEQVLARHPDHPGACHYYIHAVEASAKPERALPCAQRLPALMPGAGHLVHMPAHIYMRLGKYREAAERNVEAADVDQTYLEHRHLTGIYPKGYYLHNIHFLWAALMMEGRSAEAAKAARRLVTTGPTGDVSKLMHVERFYTAPLLTMARFGRWEDILREPAPPADWRYVSGIWHYARGLAQAATDRFGQAEAEQAEVAKAAKTLPKGQDGDVEMARQTLALAERVLAGEIAARRKQHNDAVRIFTQAVAMEQALRYEEPPPWYAPVQQHLGAVLLEAGRAGDAERVYRADLQRHPDNGWSLFGLAKSLRAQGKTIAAEDVEEKFKQAWARADVTLPASRF